MDYECTYTACSRDAVLLVLIFFALNRTSDEPATVARSTPTGPTPCVSFLPRLQEAPTLTRDGILQYDACDVGTMPNQTDPTTGLPKFGPEYGDKVSPLLSCSMCT